MFRADVYTYIFESNKLHYVWQSKEHYTKELTEGSTYYLRAVEGRRLFGGSSVSVSEVIGQMNIDNTLIRLTQCNT